MQRLSPVALISYRSDGPMTTAGSRVLLSATTKNRRRFFTRHGIDPRRVVTTVLSHGNTVATLTSKHAGITLKNVDALITDQPNIFLAVTFADCLPIFFYAPDVQAVGIVHAGRRGLQNGIIKKTIQKLKKEYGANYGHLFALVGPSIGPCHYEVPATTARPFMRDYPVAIIRRRGKIFLDLRYIARQQLIASGIQARSIMISKDCTYDDPKRYFSNRRDRPEEIEAQIAVIGLQAE